MVEYHDILWDIGYAKTFEEATVKIDNLYASRPPLEDFYKWRDERVLQEINWYGWFIDYYMENGEIENSLFSLRIILKVLYSISYHCIANNVFYIVFPFYYFYDSRFNERYVHYQDHHSKTLVHAHGTHRIHCGRIEL